ncbi:MAG: hypothetical protein LKF93_04835 [Bifidobacterium tibiigranuli]|nr:hypothetical protein [Bifidobacterium tibiigranuli]
MALRRGALILRDAQPAVLPMPWRTVLPPWNAAFAPCSVAVWATVAAWSVRSAPMFHMDDAADAPMCFSPFDTRCVLCAPERAGKTPVVGCAADVAPDETGDAEWAPPVLAGVGVEAAGPVVLVGAW